MPGIGLSFFDQPYMAASMAASISDPTEIPNLYTWLHAEAGVRDSGGNPIVADGTDVQYWDDQAGAGIDLQAISAGARPVWKSGIVNGRAVIRFNAAASECMYGASAVVPPVQTMFAVVKKNSSAAQYNTAIFDGAPANRWSIGNDSTGIYSMWVNGSANVPLLGLEYFTEEWKVICTVFDGASSKYAVNTNVLTTTSASPGSNNIAGLAIGATAVGGSPSHVDVAEFLWYSGVVSDANCRLVINWLQARYAVDFDTINWGPLMTDDFEDYADGEAIQGQTGGEGWDAGWVART